MKFIGQVTATKIGTNLWKLRDDLTYVNSKYRITAKAGMETDFASIPRAFWSVIGSPAMGRYTSSSVIHDILYMTEAIGRKEADDLFLEMLKVDGVGYFKRYSMYWAVRAGGWAVWKKHTRESVEQAKMYIEFKKLL